MRFIADFRGSVVRVDRDTTSSVQHNFSAACGCSGGIDPQSRWLNLPEYITHLLGGDPVAEFTNATHTQLVALETRDWCEEILRRRNCV